MLSDEQVRLAKTLEKAANNCIKAGLGLVAMDTGLWVARVGDIRHCGRVSNDANDLQELQSLIEGDAGYYVGNVVEWTGGW